MNIELTKAALEYADSVEPDDYVKGGIYSGFDGIELAFEKGAEWQLDHPTSDYAWKIYNFIGDYKNGKFGEDLTLQQAIDKYFKDWKQND